MVDHELIQLLLQWSATEPHRCQQKDDRNFDVLYAGQWMAVTAEPASHGALIASILEGCHANKIYCNIEYTPAFEDELPTVQVGCIHRAFRWDEGDEAIYSIPKLLLTEYLERLQPEDIKAEA
jgi:hypothetical protein